MLETTPARVAAPNPPSAVDEAIPDEDIGWEPLALPRAIRSHRTYRIPVILISLVAAAGAYFAAQFALRLPLAHADEQRGASTRVLQTTLDAMPDLRAAAAAVTDPDPADDLGSHLATLVRMGGLAADLQTVAQHPMPLMIPGLPTGDLASLEPIQDRMDTIADRITIIAEMLADAADYQRALGDMFLLPELPDPSEGPSVEVLADRLSEMTAATVAAAARLPNDDLYAAHRSEVEALITWLPEWQAAYLDALRDDDLVRADALRDEAMGRIARLRSDLGGPLAALADWTSDAIARLTLDIQAALILTA
ncbi:MAG: hypothetical protein KKE89_08205 [Actinobacteria bacterium]|nr:hypothetical protein [Actinomycetota bacterium]